MTHPLPLFPPLFAPGEWWRLYLRGRMEGRRESDSIEEANRLCGMRARDWMRFRLKDDTVISMPVEGGASALKNYPPAGWSLSKEATREARKGDATIATLYGSTPFHHLLAPELSLSDCIAQAEASAVCRKAFEKVARILNIYDDTLLISASDNANREILKLKKEDIDSAFSPQLSILDAVMRHGPETIFALIGSF